MTVKQVIEQLEECRRANLPYYIFSVGRWAGYSPAVVSALKRRGYTVEHTAVHGQYKVYQKEVANG